MRGQRWWGDDGAKWCQTGKRFSVKPFLRDSIVLNHFERKGLVLNHFERKGLVLNHRERKGLVLNHFER